MSAITFNVIISGNSVSGNLSTSRDKLVIDLGNSDKIGKVTFALQNKDSAYSTTLLSGNAMFQVDAMLGNTVVQTVFRGTLEEANALADVQQGSETQFTGYDYGQELLGLVSPDGRQQSLLTSTGSISTVSGDQGMNSTAGMDMVFFVSGVVGSGSTGSITSGAQLNLFMSQFYGNSGDTTGSNSGQSFSFKPYFSGISTSGANAFYRTWYAQDGASDSNANYWIPYNTLKVRREYAWDVLRKLTRHGYVVDRSGFKVQFETSIGVSGDIHLRTSGTSDFVASGISLVYYQAGNSGADNNNIKKAKLPWNTAGVKDYLIGWFPTWTQYPFTDDFSDLIAYSGAYWSGSQIAGTTTLSGNSPAPGAPGFISIMGTNISGSISGGISLIFTLWPSYSIDIQKWNTSGGRGVSLNYFLRASTNGNIGGFIHDVALYDTSGNFAIKSGGTNTGSNGIPGNMVFSSGWTQVIDVIYTASGTFLSGTGQDGGWAFSTSGPDFTRIKQLNLGFGISSNSPASNATTYVLQIDNINFQFSYNFNPVITTNSGSVSIYKRRYGIFEFPYQTTDSGATGIVTTELQSKMLSRQLAEFIVKDAPSQRISAQLNIVPGQAFVLDAPSLAAGSGQFYYYFVATEVKHEWSHQTGFETHIRAYPWFSGQTVGSGQNLISYSLTTPLPAPRPFQAAPNTTFWPVPVGVVVA